MDNKFIIGGFVWSICSEKCLEKLEFTPAETIERKMRLCSECNTRNSDLLTVLAGGPVPIKKNPEPMQLNIEAVQRLNQDESI